MDAVQPGVLGAHIDFKSTYAKPVCEDHSVLETLKETLEGRGDSKRPSVLLRRMKEDHLEGLPEKYIHLEDRKMPVTQAQAYDRVLADVRGRHHEQGAMLEAQHHLRSVSLLPREAGPEAATNVAEFGALTALGSARSHREAGKSLVFIEFLKVQEA